MSAVHHIPCAHCGATVATREVSDAPIYCCSGCEAVAALLQDNGWDDFYARREGFSPRPEAAATAAFDEPTYQRRFVRALDDGTAEVRMRVGGVRCAACVWLNERALTEQDGVLDAHVSYGTSVATVRFDPARTTPAAMAGTIASLGYRPQEPGAPPRASREELVRLGVAAFCAMNVMFIHVAIYFGDASGMAERHHALFAWAALVLATPAVLFAATPFFSGSMAALRHRRISMDAPIAIAIAVMYVHGLVATRLGEPAYLDSLVMLIAFLLGGRVLVAHGRDRAAEAAEAVLSGAPDLAQVERDGTVCEVPAEALAPGDILVAGEGMRLAADAIALEGDGAWVDLSHVTGEAEPVAVVRGAELPAGAAVVSGLVRASVLRDAAGSAIAQMEAMVRGALDGRTRTGDAVDRMAPKFTFAVLAVAALAGAAWWATAGLGAAVQVVVAVLVVACPCALALAAPTTLAVGIGAAARRGAFVRSGDALLALSEVTSAAIDKTGTLTEGRPRVLGGSDDALALAASVEIGSRHPVARAITSEAHNRGLALFRASDVRPLAGGGVEGVVDGGHVRVAPEGPGQIRVTKDGVPVGALRLRDTLRSDAANALRDLGVPVDVLSGDHPDVVAQVVAPLPIRTASGGLRPDAKAGRVADASAAGERVLFVGDGLNDAPALAAAHVGVAMGEGAAAAVLAADIVVLRDDLAPVASALQIAHRAKRALRRNARFAIAYNICAVALAASGHITPLWAAVLMPISSLVVVIGALSVAWRLPERPAASASAAQPPVVFDDTLTPTAA